MALLVGFLDVPSGTRRQLVGRVGVRVYSLRDAALAELGSMQSAQTPGHLFSQ